MLTVGSDFARQLPSSISILAGRGTITVSTGAEEEHEDEIRSGAKSAGRHFLKNNALIFKNFMRMYEIYHIFAAHLKKEVSA